MRVKLIQDPALLDGQWTLHLLLLDPSLHAGVLRHRHQVEVKVPDGDGRRRPRSGRRRGHGDGHRRRAVPVVAALVAAERLARGEPLPADGAPVRPTGRSRPSRGRRRRRRRLLGVGRGNRLLLLRRRGGGVLLRRGRLAVAGLVAAERLVRREGLPAHRAPEPELLLVRQRRRRWAPLLLLIIIIAVSLSLVLREAEPSDDRLVAEAGSSGTGERGEADGEVVLLVDLEPRHQAGRRRRRRQREGEGERGGVKKSFGTGGHG